MSWAGLPAGARSRPVLSVDLLGRAGPLGTAPPPGPRLRGRNQRVPAQSHGLLGRPPCRTYVHTAPRHIGGSGTHLWLEDQYFTMCFTTRTTQKRVSGTCRLWGWDESGAGGVPAAARGPGCSERWEIKGTLLGFPSLVAQGQGDLLVTPPGSSFSIVDVQSWEGCVLVQS